MLHRTINHFWVKIPILPPADPAQGAAMKNLLTTAIEEQRLIHLLYDGKSRTVETHVMGKNDRNEDVFLGRQISPQMPKEKSWQIFQLNRIYGLLILDTQFNQPLDPIELPAQVRSGIRQML